MSRGLRVTFVVMAGGKGERLWPLVRRTRPKVCLSPDGKRTLLQATIDRLRAIWQGAGWLIVTTQGQAKAVRATLPPALRRSVLVEPQIKNTAACITLAALAVGDPQRVLVIVPADQWIRDVRAFRQAVRAAIHAAVQYDAIATIGIRPTHPHTGLGYVRAGAPLNGPHRQPRVFWLSRFVEKPSAGLARRLMAQPRTYWNSGLFVGTADKFLECMTRWLPNHTRQLAPLASATTRTSFARRARAAYQALEAVSFDRGVMDHLREGVVVEGRFAWADLGTWEAWAHLSPTSSRVLGVESRNIRVVSHEPHLVATVGVRNLLVVHTPTATLICSPKRTQAVRHVVSRLAADPKLAAFL